MHLAPILHEGARARFYGRPGVPALACTRTNHRYLLQHPPRSLWRLVREVVVGRSVARFAILASFREHARANSRGLEKLVDVVDIDPLFPFFARRWPPLASPRSPTDDALDSQLATPPTPPFVRERIHGPTLAQGPTLPSCVTTLRNDARSTHCSRKTATP